MIPTDGATPSLPAAVMRYEGREYVQLVPHYVYLSFAGEDEYYCSCGRYFTTDDEIPMCPQIGKVLPWG